MSNAHRKVAVGTLKTPHQIVHSDIFSLCSKHHSVKRGRCALRPLFQHTHNYTMPQRKMNSLDMMTKFKSEEAQFIGFEENKLTMEKLGNNC